MLPVLFQVTSTCCSEILDRNLGTQGLRIRLAFVPQHKARLRVCGQQPFTLYQGPNVRQAAHSFPNHVPNIQKN